MGWLLWYEPCISQHQVHGGYLQRLPDIRWRGTHTLMEFYIYMTAFAVPS